MESNLKQNYSIAPISNKSLNERRAEILGEVKDRRIGLNDPTASGQKLFPRPEAHISKPGSVSFTDGISAPAVSQGIEFDMYVYGTTSGAVIKRFLTVTIED